MSAGNGKTTITLSPSPAEMKGMVEAAMNLMNIKKNEWILKQLSFEQLLECKNAFDAEIGRRMQKDYNYETNENDKTEKKV